LENIRGEAPIGLSRKDEDVFITRIYLMRTGSENPYMVYGGSENPYMVYGGNVAEMEGYEDDEEERAWREKIWMI
jgi:hypothetical protein